jgi:hypothetical protein
LSIEKPNLLDPSYLDPALEAGPAAPRSAVKLGARFKPEKPISWSEIWREAVLQNKTRTENHHAM